MSDSTPTPSSKSSRGEERRRARRVETSRVAYYSRTDGSGPLRQGAVVNMSAGGMRIRAREAEANGTELTIELRPEGKGEDDEAAIFQGRVVSVSGGEGTDVDLGIRLLAHKPGGVVSGGGRGVQRRYRRPERNVGNVPFARIVRTKSSGTRGKHRRYLLLLMVLALLVPPALRTEWRRLNSIAPVEASPELRREVAIPGIHSANARALGRSQRDAPRRVVRSVNYSQPELARLGPFLQAGPGRFLTAPMEFASFTGRGPGLPAKSAHSEIVQLLARAERADEIGERGLALALARDAYETASEQSSVWEDAARATLDDLQHGRPLAKRLRDMDGLVTLGDATNPPRGEGTKIEVRIDRARFALTVFRGGAPLRAFAVGIGEDGATPVGSFRIANKLTDPGWYNRGNVVPAGDPGNPIGHRWMGLGGNEGAMSIGIHPTAAPDSIGSGLSQGCIRMWPEDAESLFRLCAIGTPVTVE